MVRIPIGNEKSARIEVRSIAPDSNPYMAIYSLFKIGTDTSLSAENRVLPDAVLPDNIYDAIDHFCGSEVIRSVLGNTVTEKYGALKQASAERCPRLLGSKIKRAEIQFHHEVTNQFLWNQF
jgi:glutamine synthetase